jgi:hypothetical protein
VIHEYGIPVHVGGRLTLLAGRRRSDVDSARFLRVRASGKYCECNTRERDASALKKLRDVCQFGTVSLLFTMVFCCLSGSCSISLLIELLVPSPRWRLSFRSFLQLWGFWGRSIRARHQQEQFTQYISVYYFWCYISKERRSDQVYEPWYPHKDSKPSLGIGNICLCLCITDLIAFFPNSPG